MKVVLIISGLMAVIGIFSNVLAYYLEKTYKSKINKVSNNSDN